MLHLPLFVIVTRAFHAIYRLFTSSHPRPPQPCQAPSWMALKERPVGVVGLTSGIKSTTYLMYLGAGMVCIRCTFDFTFFLIFFFFYLCT